jgi:hypothetical protein
VPRTSFPPDRFDDLPPQGGRVGAHRAENPHLRGWVVFLWAAVATVILIVAGIFGSLVVGGRIVLFPTPTPTASPTPSITPVIDTTYTVVILDATGGNGKADAAKAKLVAAGWSSDSVLASAAGSTYPVTTVYYPLPADVAAAEGVARLIGGAKVVQSTQYQPAATPDAAQLVIVLGTDRVSHAPTPTK